MEERVEEKHGPRHEDEAAAEHEDVEDELDEVDEEELEDEEEEPEGEKGGGAGPEATGPRKEAEPKAMGTARAAKKALGMRVDALGHHGEQDGEERRRKTRGKNVEAVGDVPGDRDGLGVVLRNFDLDQRVGDPFEVDHQEAAAAIGAQIERNMIKVLERNQMLVGEVEDASHGLFGL